MAKTYAAFYVKDETMENDAVDSNMFKTLVDNIKTLGEKHSFDDIKELAKRLNAVNVTEFTQEYLVHGLSKIINGEPLKFEMLGDCIFNEFAPELNATLWQSGYNSLNEMRRAAFAGKNYIQCL